MDTARPTPTKRLKNPKKERSVWRVDSRRAAAGIDRARMREAVEPPDELRGVGAEEGELAEGVLKRADRLAEGALVVDALFDPLVRLDAQNRVVPAAAESWEVEEEGRVLVFRLREATFHDGDPVTAQDFVRSFQRLTDGTADPPSFLGYLLEPVEGWEEAITEGEPLAGVEAVDTHVLRVELRDPHPGFLRTLADPALAPVPEAADSDLEAFGAQPVGNGPFQMVEARQPDQFIRLARYDDHHQPAQLDEVVLQIYADDSAGDRQWEDFVEGQLQVAEVPPDRLEEAVTEYGLSVDGYRGPGVLTGITSTVYLYGFNLREEPFDDARVRRAISLAIDRDALADVVMGGTRAAANSLVPPPVPGAQRATCVACEHDPEAAASLWQEAMEDWEEPFAGPLVLSYNLGSTHAAIAEQMAADIEAALNVEVEVDARDLQVFVQAIRAGELSLFRLGWEATEPDAGAYLQPLFHSSMIGRDNVTGYANEEVDELLDQARQADARAESQAAYLAAEAQILEDLPAMPLLYYRQSRAVAPVAVVYEIAP